MGAKIRTPSKSLGPQTTPPKNPSDQNLTPRKSHAEFPSHNNFQKAGIVAKQVWFYFIRGITRPGVCGNYHESSDCFQAAQKNTCQNSPTQKKSQNRKFQTSKNLSIISVATVILSVKEIRISVLNLIGVLTKKISTTIIIKLR